MTESPTKYGNTELQPETISRRRLPANVQPEDLAYFSQESEKRLAPIKLLEFRNVSISDEGMLFTGFRFLPQSFAFPYLEKEWKKRSRVKFFGRNYLLRKRRGFQRAALWIVDNWSHGYFHWLADALPRLFVVKDYLDELVLLLPHQYRSLEFVQSSLKALGVVNVEFIEEGEVLRVDRLMIPTHTAPSGHYRDDVIKGVRNLLLNAYREPSQSDGEMRIYISRSRARERRISNEEEVKRVLQEFDFKTFYAEDHTFEDQIRIVSDAAYLVSNHGAGLTNMLFMESGRSVLELRHKTDRIDNCYFTLSAALNLHYFYQLCEPENSSVDPHKANLNVDVHMLQKNIEHMIASQVPDNSETTR